MPSEAASHLTFLLFGDGGQPECVKVMGNLATLSRLRLCNTRQGHRKSRLGKNENIEGVILLVSNVWDRTYAWQVYFDRCTI